MSTTLVNDVDADAINARIERLETREGSQVVTAVIGKSDTSAELPRKAFACGASATGLTVVLADLAWPQRVTSMERGV